MKIFFAIILTLMFSLTSFGQKFWQIQTGLTNENIAMHTVISDDYSIDGSPNFNDVWQSGSISLINGDKFELDSMRYNIYLDKLTIIQDGKPYLLPESLKFDQFVIGTSLFVNSIYADGQSRGILQVLSNNKQATLYKHLQCDLVRGKPSTGMILATNDKYLKHSDYYTSIRGGNIIEIKNNKESILQVMQDEEKNIKNYIKKYKLKLKNEQGLIEVFKYYNTLNN